MFLLKAYLNLSTENNATVFSISPEYLTKSTGAAYLLPQTVVSPFLLSKWASDVPLHRNTLSRSAFEDFFWNASYKTQFFYFSDNVHETSCEMINSYHWQTKAKQQIFKVILHTHAFFCVYVKHLLVYY